MKIESSRLLDALCGEYLLGTLRGAARRRFERALREEPRTALRLKYWQETFSPRYSAMNEVQPSRRVWNRLERGLRLSRYRAPWYGRAAFWRAWTLAATAALLLAVGVQFWRPAEDRTPPVRIAELAGKDPASRVTAALHADGRTLELRASRPVIAGAAQSYELWLLPAEGGAPISLAVLGALDARFEIAASQAQRLRAGAKLAISVEPAGGSPTGGPTGPVILVGDLVI
jgi:anti-sigma-K factor RskA